MAVPLILYSDPGLGDEMFASELSTHATPVLFYDNDADAWVEAGDLSADWRIPLIDQLDRRYTALKAGLGSPGQVTHTGRNLITGIAIDSETLNIIGGNLAPVDSTPDTSGPPYTTEAGRIHSSGVLRGVRLANTPEIEGTIHAGAAPAFMARVVNAGGTAIGAASMVSAVYSIYLLSESDPDVETPVAGHVGIGLDFADVWFSSPQTDYQWGDTDETGYNFRLVPDVLLRGPAFATPRRHYRVRVTITPITGQPFQIRFRPWAI